MGRKKKKKQHPGLDSWEPPEDSEEELGEEEEEEEEEDKSKVKMKYDEYGRPKYDYRYVVGVQKKNDSGCYKHVKEGNVFKDMKKEADAWFKDTGRAVQVWDREKWCDDAVYELYQPELDE